MQRIHRITQISVFLFFICLSINNPLVASHYRELYTAFYEHFFIDQQPIKSSAVAWDMLIDKNQSLNPHAGLSIDTVLEYVQTQIHDPISFDLLPQNPLKLLIIPYHTHHNNTKDESRTRNRFTYRLFDIDIFLRLIETAQNNNRTAQEPFTRDIIPYNIQQKIYVYCGRQQPLSFSSRFWHLLIPLSCGFRPH